jgi:hypothetical protein
MPSVSYDSLSFFYDGARAGVRRFPMIGAAFDPTLVEPTLWTEELVRLRRAGFNLVSARVPWSLHEPTPGRFEFSGECDVRRFVREAGAAGLRVILRIGPCVGGSFAGGGMPGWIGEFAGDRVREANPAFMQRVTGYWRRLLRECVDLQATRNGGSTERPIIAIGIEDHWHSLDDDVGTPYFGELVRCAREFGVEVPLLSANNCWYMHEGVVETWCRESDAPAARMAELREVQPDAPPMAFLSWNEGAADLAARVLARSDFIADVVGWRHRNATSAVGMAEREARDLFDLRRVLVFASSFGEVLAAMTPEDVARHIEVRARPDGQVDFFGHNLALPRFRLARSTGTLVALTNELLVVAGKPRGKLELIVDGSSVKISVPAEGAAPKCVSVRKVRVVVAPLALADGIGLSGHGESIEFVDRAGDTLFRVTADGSVQRVMNGKSAARATSRPRTKTSLRLEPVVALAESGFRDGTHARFAATTRPSSLGACGVVAQTAYYRARFKLAGKSKRLYALPHARMLDAAVTVDGTRHLDAARGPFEVSTSGAHVLVAEVRNLGTPPIGRTAGAPVGLFGGLVEIAPLARVKRDAVPLPSRDATQVGRFVWGFDVNDGTDARTMRWSFPQQKCDVLVWIPPRVADAMVAGDHVLRLNGELLPCIGPAGSASFVLLPAAKLSPMKPKALKKGEKPPKARNAVLEPGDNELVYDGVPHADAKDVRIFAVKSEVAAAWAFARADPPASWATAKPLAKAALARKTGVPTWFRTSFHLEAPRAVSLCANVAAGARATVLVNGAGVLVQDGVSGTTTGSKSGKMSSKMSSKGTAAQLLRTAIVAATNTRAGVNEVLVFSPDGRMPDITIA